MYFGQRSTVDYAVNMAWVKPPQAEEFDVPGAQNVDFHANLRQILIRKRSKLQKIPGAFGARLDFDAILTELIS